MSDADFDAMSRLIDPKIDTGYPLLDEFFRKEFHPSTGMWIHKHPKLDDVAAHYHFLKRIGAYNKR